MRGANIAFKLRITLDGFGLTHHEFVGTVDGDGIKGSMTVTPLNQAPITLPWRARRTLRSDYYAPTGHCNVPAVGSEALMDTGLAGIPSPATLEWRPLLSSSQRVIH